MLLLASIDRTEIVRLLAGYGLALQLLPTGAPIPGSYWGESEAGLRASTLFARADTPLHSILHETAHYICMSPQRRVALDRDAGGDDAEESAVCYLQMLLAGTLACGRARLAADMDAWGYSFRLGAAAQWFTHDAQDSQLWLQRCGIIDPCSRLTGALRG